MQKEKRKDNITIKTDLKNKQHGIKAVLPIKCRKASVEFGGFFYTFWLGSLIKDELNTFYIALTRAKKEVFLTVNSRKNQWGDPNKTNCFINLEGREKQDFN